MSQIKLDARLCEKWLISPNLSVIPPPQIYFPHLTIYQNAQVTNLNIPRNIGYLGAGRHKMQYPDTKTNTKTYMSWKNMLDRCYGKQNRNLHPAYFDISTVCDEWLNFQTFADWYEEREYKCDGRLHLDKDILFLYSLAILIISSFFFLT